MATHEGASAHIRNALQILYGVKSQRISDRTVQRLHGDLDAIRSRLVDALAGVEKVREHIADSPPEVFACDDDHAAFQLLSTEL